VNRKYNRKEPGNWKQLKDEIMKTNIRTIIGIVALGLIGFVNINAAFINAAAFDTKRVVTSVVEESEESLEIESWMLEEVNWTPKTSIDKAESDKVLKVEAWMTDKDIFFKAEPAASLCADKKMGK
jgi:hypothetical protein